MHAKANGDEDVQQEDQRGNQGNRGRGHHQIQTMHVRVPVVAILGGGPVAEEQSGHGHKENEAYQGPQRGSPPGSPFGEIFYFKIIFF